LAVNWNQTGVCALIVSLLGSGCGGSGLAGPSAPNPTATTTPTPAVAAKPNIILVLLDDGENAMVSNFAGFQSTFIDRGIRFTNAFSTTPLCGPARANLLAGAFTHNTGVLGNVGSDSGYPGWVAGGFDGHNIGPWMKAAGYKTGIFGKYQNDYPTGAPETFVPPGWDDWRVVMSDRVASNDNYTMNENGTLRIYSASNNGYQADVLSDRLQSFIRSAESSDSEPFFAFVSLGAPHTPTAPAARHMSAFPGATAPRGPSFNEADISDKPFWLQDQSPLMDAATIAGIDEDYRGSLQALLAVQEAMDALFRTLDQLGETSSTYVFFTSDNGLHRGEHRLRGGKNTAYQESTRMPLYVRGPGVPANRPVEHLAGLVDLAPTFLGLAGAPIPESVDGMSLAPLLGLSAPALSTWRQEILIEHPGGAGLPIRIPGYYGVRTQTELYVEYENGEIEYYDLRSDPLELENLVRRASSSTISRLSARVAALSRCRGASCRP
jgi:arylsulfatase A-like enzyme